MAEMLSLFSLSFVPKPVVNRKLQGDYLKVDDGYGYDVVDQSSRARFETAKRQFAADDDLHLPLGEKLGVLFFSDTLAPTTT